MKKLIFTSDILKVDDRMSDKISSPQDINIDWIYELFSGHISDATGVSAYKVHGEKQFRMEVYSGLGLPFCSSSWAEIYHRRCDPYLKQRLLPLFEGSLVVGFELPPYLTSIFEEAGIDYLDMSIHPIRFMEDYVFGVRSNVQEWCERLDAVQVPPATLDGYARISRARSARVYRNRKIEPGSALFLGQLEIDSSLISEGRVAKLDDVEEALLSLLEDHSAVYYKFHPHRHDKSAVESLISRIPRVNRIEVNVYDAMYAPEFFLISSMSSGALHEARAFGRPVRRFIDSRHDPFDLESYAHGPAYRSVYQVIWGQDFWRYLLKGEPMNEVPLYLGQHPFKFSLNQKWGR